MFSILSYSPGKVCSMYNIAFHCSRVPCFCCTPVLNYLVKSVVRCSSARWPPKQGDFRVVWHYSLCSCTAPCRKRQPHTWKWLRHRTFGEGRKIFWCKTKGTGSPRWEGRAAARKGLHFCKKFNLQAFTFTREHVHGLLAEYMGLPSARTCMSILREARAGALCAMSPGFCTGQANQIWGHIQVLSRIPSRVQTCIAEP